MGKSRVLFLCTGNSCRSQMAEGFLKQHGGDRFVAESAGTNPAGLNPGAVEAMSEVGVDISGHVSQHVDELRGQSFDYVVTVCDNAREACPTFPGPSHRLHWSFEDPAAASGSPSEKKAVFRRVRNEIEARILEFVQGKDPAG